MGKRRDTGTGSVYWSEERQRWVAEIDAPPKDGKRRKHKRYFKRKQDAQRQVQEWTRGDMREPERQTLAEFLQDWLENTVRRHKAPKTYQSYEGIVRLHLIPALGHIHLDRLTAQHIARLVAQMQDNGEHSNRTIEYVVKVLSRALNKAVQFGLLSRNPAEHVDTPRVQQRKPIILNKEQRAQLLAALDNHRLKPLYIIALHLGLRRGELVDLYWSDLALDSSPPTLRVGESKTPAGRRTIVLSSMLVQVLREHWTAQQEERAAAGLKWKEHGRVFPSETGTPLLARNLYRHFQQTLEKASLPPMPFHDLRHICASLLAEAGVHPAVARDILGHESISTTMNIYTHVATDEVKRAIERMQDVV